MQEASSSSTLSYPPSRYVFWLVLPLWLMFLGTKVHKMLALGTGIQLGAFWMDAVIALTLYALFYAALRFAPKSLRFPVILLSHLLVYTAMVLAFIEHGFWMKTGTMVDGYMLLYGLREMDSLGTVFLSEMGWGVLLSFLFLCASQLLPFLMRALALKKEGRPKAFGRFSIFILAFSLLLFGAFRLFATNDKAPMLERNAAFGLAQDFWTLSQMEEEEDAHAEGQFQGEAFPRLETQRTAEALQKKNVILLVLESFRATATSLHEPYYPTTPFLKELAEKGAHAESAWTIMTHTSKALVGLLCGVEPYLDAPIEEATPSGLPMHCLARALRERGYRTAFMQSATRLFENRRQLTENMGYETFKSMEDLPQKGFEKSSYFGFEDRILEKPILEWIQESDEPFFLTALTLTTHHNYRVPKSIKKESFHKDGTYNNYLNTIHYTDRFVKELVEGLEASGHMKDTLLVIMGDHGEGFKEHLRSQHDSVIYEEGTHVPLLLVGEGIAPGTVISHPRTSLDVVPTVLEWLGTPVVSELPGKSLLSTEGHPTIYTSCWLHKYCMAARDERYKYIWHYSRQKPELFDLKEDPLETTNLLAKGDHEAAKVLHERLFAWKDESDVRWKHFLGRALRDYVGLSTVQAELPLAATFYGEKGQPLAQVLGAEGPQKLKAGEPVDLAVYWKALSPIPEGYALFMHVTRISKGKRVSRNEDHEPVFGRHPLSAWKEGEVLKDLHRIQPWNPLPRGRYAVYLGLWDKGGKDEGSGGRAKIESEDSLTQERIGEDMRLKVWEFELE